MCEYEDDDDEDDSAGEIVCGMLRGVVQHGTDELGPGGYTCWYCSPSRIPWRSGWMLL